jgi:hypothetical protein
MTQPKLPNTTTDKTTRIYSKCQSSAQKFARHISTVDDKGLKYQDKLLAPHGLEKL